MTTREADVIEAAGGAVWRDAADGSGVEIAVIHRPKYDDWSLPKGKLMSGEHPVVGAHREICEETGFETYVGAPLGEIGYLKDGRPKRVRYWAMEAVGGGFAPNAEVDRLEWLPLAEARTRLSPDRDRAIATRLTRLTHTWPCLVLRHASAGEPHPDPEDDRVRPLDEVGQRQALHLAPILAAFGIRRVFTADLMRCRDTVQAFGESRGCPPELDPLLSDEVVTSDPEAAVRHLIDIAAIREPTLACSQRKSVRILVGALFDELGFAPPGELSLPEAGFWALHLRADPVLHLVAAERFPGER